jgi:putative CocE/NonD family hydrolase
MRIMERDDRAAQTGDGRALEALAGKSDAVELRDVMVPMRDAVRLATDIYLPAGAIAGTSPGPGGDASTTAGEGRYPAILERTPYGKERPSRSERTHLQTEPLSRAEVARYFVAKGYVVIYQDCRGRYKSEGEFTKYLSDAEDGYDTCAWITQQPWSNGLIGMKGLSYAAHTQMAAASLAAPGLRAMVVDSGGFSNAYQSGIRQGGAYELKQAAWAVMFAAEHSRRLQKPGFELTPEDLDCWFRKMPWRRGHSPLTPTPDYEEFLFDQWERGVFDSYWKQPGLYAQGHYENICNAAAIHLSSWYDVYSRTAIENYTGMVANGGRARLILGPWTHGNRWESHSGDVDFGPAARLEGPVANSFLELRLRWFDRWLKAPPPVAAKEPAVQLFVMGGGSGRRNAEGRLDHGGRWRDEAEWPPAGTRQHRFHLHAGGVLDSNAPPVEPASISYRFDPADPVITIGGSVVERPPAILAGGFDQVEQARFFGCKLPGRPLAERADVLVFQTAALADDTEVTGDIAVELWVSSDCPDTDFTAKLVDQYPPSEDYPAGFALNLTDGILRARYRDSWERPEMMQPGQVYRLRIQLFPTSNLFRRGHRIRLDISSSNFPKFDVNPNTGDDEAKSTHSRIATNTIHFGPHHPSSLVLPVSGA